MLRRAHQLRVQVYQIIDVGIFEFALRLAHQLRALLYDLPFFRDPITPFNQDYFTLFLAVIPMAPLVLAWQGYYERPLLTPMRRTIWQLGKACALCAVGLVLTQFMLRRGGARAVFVLFGFCSFGLMLLKEEILRTAYKTRLGQSQFKRRVVLLGGGGDTSVLRTEIASGMEELEVVGNFDLNETLIEDMVLFLHEHSINTVVIAARHTHFGTVEKAIYACELEGVEAWLMADFFQTQISQTSLDDFYGRPVLVFHSGPETRWPLLVKQIIDFFGGLALLAVFSLPMLAAAIAIKLTSPGPVFFRQQRAGLNGKPFVMYKFRSMVSDAEQLKQELAALNEMSGPVFKVTNDPRVTRVGRLLRKYSIDEFPQLFNVLRFEMSLVGPRPLPVDEVKRFDDRSHRRRLSVKPGLTCMWQVSGRSNVTDFKEWVRMDLDYIDNWSLGQDCKILWRTIWVVLSGKGAR
ncbi:MAG TPA: sugar transferase [Candidatus Saccharimonadales bacterium]|nr:sugar transferase [Candidatus Saccharimonadales bacterium]